MNELETNGSIKMLKSEIGHQCEVINSIAAILLQQGGGLREGGKQDIAQAQNESWSGHEEFVEDQEE